MSRVKVILNCVADQYVDKQTERIIEFSSDHGGGLISFFKLDDGRLIVSVYNTDPTVEVRTR